MTIYLTQLDSNPMWFPAPHDALDEPNGLLAMGGDLSCQRVLHAYQQGIFPWYGPGEPILWWSPSPRAVFTVQDYQPSRSVKKFQRKHHYKISINHATSAVIQNCANCRPIEETWLNQEMINTYQQLAQQGYCHSVEVWQEDTLVGGLYGIIQGKVFCGESMFSLKTNASKIALWYFCEHFKKYDGELIDCQVMNSHLQSLGATELPRSLFLTQLHTLQAQAVDETCFIPQIITLTSSREKTHD